MTAKVINSKLEKVVAHCLSITDFTVCDRFIKFRNAHAAKMRPDDRSEYQRLFSSDCLLIEKKLEWAGLVTSPSDNGHDYIIISVQGNVFKLDNKTYTSKYGGCYKINKDYARRILAGHINHTCTHIVLTEFVTGGKELFKVGDSPTFKVNGVRSLQHVYDNLILMDDGQYYYKLKEE